MKPMSQRSLTHGSRGFSILELLVTMAITMVVMAGTMQALSSAVRASDSAKLVTNLNTGLRVAMDLVVRDMLQVGQGLPTGRFVTLPSGTGATAIRLPGPPNTTYTLPVGTVELNAITPGPGRGPVINGQATDMVTTLAADSSFENRQLTALTDTSMTVALTRATPLPAIPKGANITDGGEDDLDPGDLIMLTRGSLTCLVQVTNVSGQVVTFAAGDSLNLNQTSAADGTLREFRQISTGPIVNDAVVAATGSLQSVATRVRLITYYIDAVTDPAHPRLVRRMNNGHPTTFDNKLGTAVAFDVENLQISYDLADGTLNPANVRMVTADYAVGGACGTIACDPERIRKVNVLLSARARQPARVTRQIFRNSLLTQVSLRSLAFVDKYE